VQARYQNVPWSLARGNRRPAPNPTAAHPCVVPRKGPRCSYRNGIEAKVDAAPSALTDQLSDCAQGLRGEAGDRGRALVSTNCMAVPRLGRLRRRTPHSGLPSLAQPESVVRRIGSNPDGPAERALVAASAGAGPTGRSAGQREQTLTASQPSGTLLTAADQVAQHDRVGRSGPVATPPRADQLPNRHPDDPRASVHPDGCACAVDLCRHRRSLPPCRTRSLISRRDQ
jgi:hypothetical protein